MAVGSRRVRAWVALVSFLAGYGVAFLTGAHLIADDDTACATVPLSGYSTTVDLHRDAPAPPPEHCPLCHLLRQASGAHVSAVATLFLAGQATAADTLREARPKAATCIERRASRAPPTPTAA